MKTTAYFAEQVLRKRPHLRIEWIKSVLERPTRVERQPDGRRRHWGPIVDDRDGKTRHLRVVTLEDGITVHNAFFDRDYRETEP